MRTKSRPSRDLTIFTNEIFEGNFLFQCLAYSFYLSDQDQVNSGKIGRSILFDQTNVCFLKISSLADAFRSSH